jgi:hypothetical protein
MDKVIKVISAKKKLTPSKNEKETDDKVAEISNADYANGYILAHLDPESKSTVLREKKLVGNVWGGLIDEIIEREDTIKNDNDSNTKNKVFLSIRTVLNSTTPFLSHQMRTPSPVLTPPPASTNSSTFQAKAPSPRSQKKKKG